MKFKTRILAPAALVVAATVVVAPLATTTVASAATNSPATLCCRSSTVRSNTGSNPVSNPPAAKPPTKPRSVTAPVVGSSAKPRSVNAPKGTGSGVTNANAPRTVKAPVNTGSLVSGGVSRTSPVSRGPLTAPTSKVKVTGSTYSYGGAQFKYEPTGYWQSHAAPRRGTLDYNYYINDPWVVSNYHNPLSPWSLYYASYGYPTMTGYYVNSGYWVPVSSGPGVSAIIVYMFAILFVLALAALATVWWARRRNSGGSNRPRSRRSTVPLGGGWR